MSSGDIVAYGFVAFMAGWWVGPKIDAWGQRMIARMDAKSRQEAREALKDWGPS